MTGKKVSIDVTQTADLGFKIDFATGFMKNETQVAETVDSLVTKVSAFLRREVK